MAQFRSWNRHDVDPAKLSLSRRYRIASPQPFRRPVALSMRLSARCFPVRLKRDLAAPLRHAGRREAAGHRGPSLRHTSSTFSASVCKPSKYASRSTPGSRASSYLEGLVLGPSRASLTSPREERASDRGPLFPDT